MKADRLMKRAIVTLAALILLVAGPGELEAQSFINGDFETGSYSGWSTTGPTAVVGANGFGTLTISPYGGVYQASLSSQLNNFPSYASDLDAFLGLTSGTLEGMSATNGSAIKQTVTVDAGDVLTFQWYFATSDYVPYNDFGFVTIDGVLTILDTTATLGNIDGFFTGTGYQSFSYAFGTAGTYTIGLGVVNAVDEGMESRLYADDFSIASSADSPAVPEPSSLILLGTAIAVFAAHFGLRQRNRLATG
jgi:PEP-CTERM motif